VQPSATLALAQKAAELKRQGRDVISFTTGEPDFDTPAGVKAAAVAAIESGFTKYTASSGILELKEAICHKLWHENGVSYSPEEVIVSAGAKQAIYNVLQAVCDPGSEVIIPTPCWVSYPEQVKLAGGVPVFVRFTPDSGFGLDLAAVKAALTPRTVAVIINSPNNPTGAVYEQEALHELGELALERKFWIISDEVYEKLTYDGTRHVSIASLDPRFKEVVVTVNGVSKTFAMTGWRIGYAAGPRQLIAAMGRIQDHVTGNANSIAQKAALFALTQSRDYEIMRLEYEIRRDLMISELAQVPGVRAYKPRGAFYLFPEVSALFGRAAGKKVVANSWDLADFLLEEAAVAVVPGAAFHGEGCIRLTFAVARDRIEEGVRRIVEALSLLT
jgi:aspartate aminotransferase